MIQLVVNVNLLREIDERKLINAYARHVYNDEIDVTDDTQIKTNLIELLDWDKNGEQGLEIYCSKFEGIKNKDWERLIQFIKENHHEIKSLAYNPLREKKLESIKVISSAIEKKEQHNIERFTDENYQVSGRGRKAKTCVYNGKEYKSRQECIYKERISKHTLYTYLKETGQL